MTREKAVVLCSGGLNSAVLTSVAAAEHPFYLLHARYGSRAAKRELEMFEELVEHLNIAEKLVVEMPQFAAIGESARVNRRRQLQDALALGNAPSNCHVPGLVASLLAAGYAYAHHVGATKIYIGLSENLGPPAPQTSTIYPDYNREFIQLYGHRFGVVRGETTIAVETPLIDLDREAIIQLGRRMRTPFELTWSCVAGDETPCTRCVGCATRTHGFLKAAVPDPLAADPSIRPDYRQLSTSGAR